MNAIVTLTMNPALDLATDIDELVPDKKLRCGSEREDPGGGGISVARMLQYTGAQMRRPGFQPIERRQV